MRKPFRLRTAVLIGAALLLVAALGIGTGISAKYRQEVAVHGTIYYDPTLAESLACIEHKAQRGADGVYTLGDRETAANAYVLMPGVDAPRDVFVRIEGKTAAAAYLYVEVVDELSDDNVAFDLTDDWEKLEDVTGRKGGTLYVYKDIVDKSTGRDEGAGETPDEDAPIEIPLIKDDSVTVSHKLLPGASGEKTLSFYPYLCRAKDDKTAAECFDLEGMGDGTEDTYTLAPDVTFTVSDSAVTVGDTDYSVYIRATVTFNWRNAEGELLAAAPEESTDYTFTPGDGWSEGSDGYYYYARPVESGQSTTALLNGLTRTGTAPEGCELVADMAAEAIQSAGATDEDDVPAVTDAWGCTVGDDMTISK